MNKVILLLLMFAIALPSFAYQSHNSTYVRGYTKRDGSYVQGYRRSTPNYTQNDNWSTRGNYNPYTLKQGTQTPQSNYGYGYNQNTRRNSGYYGY